MLSKFDVVGAPASRVPPSAPSTAGPHPIAPPSLASEPSDWRGRHDAAFRRDAPPRGGHGRAAGARLQVQPPEGQGRLQGRQGGHLPRHGGLTPPLSLSLSLSLALSLALSLPPPLSRLPSPAAPLTAHRRAPRGVPRARQGSRPSRRRDVGKVRQGVCGKAADPRTCLRAARRRLPGLAPPPAPPPPSLPLPLPPSRSGAEAEERTPPQDGLTSSRRPSAQAEVRRTQPAWKAAPRAQTICRYHPETDPSPARTPVLAGSNLRCPVEEGLELCQQYYAHRLFECPWQYVPNSSLTDPLGCWRPSSGFL